MRKLAFVTIENEPVKKIILYQKKKEKDVFFFGGHSLFDVCDFDLWFADLSDAEETAYEEYGVQPDDWIEIADPQEFCQEDMIMPVRVKGRGKFEILLPDGRWVDHSIKGYESLSFNGLTGNERLWFSGLLYEFEKAEKRDKNKALKILKGLGFDDISIKQILHL